MKARKGRNSGDRDNNYRRNGNVARLPKEVRDRINEMIQDGVPYRVIVEKLGEEGKEVSISGLSRWKDGGYQDWVVEQAFIARTRARQETPGELVRGTDATEVNQAALQLGTLHIFDALRDLGPGSLNKKLGGDCAAFARLINALARASRETMVLQKYREACAKARAALQPLRDPNRKLTDAERRAIVLEVDDILGTSPEEGSANQVGSAEFGVRSGQGRECREGLGIGNRQSPVADSASEIADSQSPIAESIDNGQSQIADSASPIAKSQEPSPIAEEMQMAKGI